MRALCLQMGGGGGLRQPPRFAKPCKVASNINKNSYEKRASYEYMEGMEVFLGKKQRKWTSSYENVKGMEVV